MISLFVELEAPATETTCALRGFAGINFSSNPVRVINVVPGSTAELAGLEVGDRIMSADGEPMQVATDLPEGEPGSQVELVVERCDQELTITVTRTLAPVPTS